MKNIVSSETIRNLILSHIETYRHDKVNSLLDEFKDAVVHEFKHPTNKTIAVICKDEETFEEWKEKMSFYDDMVRYHPFTSKVIDRKDRVLYKRILRPEHLKGYNYNDYIDLYDAGDNIHYEKIMELLKPNLINNKAH